MPRILETRRRKADELANDEGAGSPVTRRSANKIMRCGRNKPAAACGPPCTLGGKRDEDAEKGG
eukprot:7680858-Pyramimonas_sp.AAC.1